MHMGVQHWVLGQVYGCQPTWQKWVKRLAGFQGCKLKVHVWGGRCTGARPTWKKWVKRLAGLHGALN